MNKIVQDLSSRHYYGVVSDTPEWSVVVPVIYEQIFPHKFGYSCKIPNQDAWEAFSLDGTLLLRNCASILFLADDYLLCGSHNKKCLIYNTKTHKVVVNMLFDAVLVFLGDSNEATEFTTNSDIFDIIMKTNYQMYGAHIENMLCAKFNGAWGVIDVASNRVVTNFSHKAFIQKSGGEITALD